MFDASPLPNATNEQWDLASPRDGFDRGISADRAWNLSTGAGVVIADIDVGVELGHPDLAAQWWVNGGETPGNGRDDDRNGYPDDVNGWDFYARDGDPTSDTANAHGTNVAGVLAARAGNGIGIAGVAHGSRVMALRTSDGIIHQGRRLGEAIVYATRNGARVISMSLGADTFSASLRDSVAYAESRGVVMAVASGNEFHFHQHRPQAEDAVLAVGGLNPDTANLTAARPELATGASRFDVRAWYSNKGPHLDVVAPTQVPSTQWGGGYLLNWSGTSAATPHVAAVAALVLSRMPRLSAPEVVQIIRMTADDMTAADQGFSPGWDRFSGWGRVNAFAAVQRARPGEVPPVPDIDSPDWFAAVRGGGVEVRGTATGRSAVRWTLELGRGDQPVRWREVGRGGTRRRPSVLARLASLEAGGWTLRMRAVDADGNVGEDRAYFTVVDGLHRGFPIRLGSSGEASPALADLDGDGALDLLLATSDGVLHARSVRRRRSLPGWPRRMATVAGPLGRRGGPRALHTPWRAGLVATPAVGDIGGSRAPEVIAAGLDGRIYARSARGRRVRGFPARISIKRPAEGSRLDAAVYASPALADLDGNGRLDVVVAGADQRVHAFDGRGRPLPGWPVLARAGGDVAKILSSPAIGDLDGDGSPDVVVGTGEAYGTTPFTQGRVHAFDARGRPLPGWPVAPPGLATDSIPLVGEGVPMSPVLTDVDGDGRDEVAVTAFTGPPQLYGGDGRALPGASGTGGRFATTGRGSGSRATAPAVIGLGANAAFGRLRPGPPMLFGGMVDDRLAQAQLSPANPVSFEHLVGGWNAATGEWLPGYPAPIEGWTIVAAPAVADVTGDGRAEVIAGSSGNRLHAFGADGRDVEGWPKDTGQWLLASPAVGDVDGDRRLEVVAVSRDGHVFVWDTPASASPAPDWPSFRHDARNTGRLPAQP